MNCVVRMVGAASSTVWRHPRSRRAAGPHRSWRTASRPSSAWRTLEELPGQHLLRLRVALGVLVVRLVDILEGLDRLFEFLRRGRGLLLCGGRADDGEREAATTAGRTRRTRNVMRGSLGRCASSTVRIRSRVGATLTTACAPASNGLLDLSRLPPVAITMGDPAGVGPELCLRLFRDEHMAQDLHAHHRRRRGRSSGGRLLFPFSRRPDRPSPGCSC